MAIKDRDSILAAIKLMIGDNTSDDALAILEDLTDTFNNYEELVSDTVDWKQKYNTLDETWRKRYRERFFSGTTAEEVLEEQQEDILDDAENRTFEDLFEEREG